MLETASLPAIVTLARAGALHHAWLQFCAAGYDRASDDPVALTVMGRLLKDFALRSEGDERRGYYLRSADAYRRAAALRPATYPLINAATLSLLSGDRDQAEQVAREVLDRIAHEPEEPETPYWRAATEAEALLLLGRPEAARAALDTAVAAAPEAWEDHASTLRQFLIIQAELGGDTTWLDRLRPRRSLHYAALASVEIDSERVGAISRCLDEENVGFGYGSLTAGAEVEAAEALIARGGELHVILPSDAASFAARFVDPFGAAWRSRFDRMLEAAATIDHVRPLGSKPEDEVVDLAREVALGASILNAERLLGESVALRVGAIETPPSVRTRTIDAATAAPDRKISSAPANLPLAVVALGVGGGAETGFEDRLARVQGVLGSGGQPRIAPHLAGDCILVGYSTPAEAAEVARRLHAQLGATVPLRIAAHYGLIPCVRDPFTGTVRPTELGAAIATEIAASMPPDTICVSQDFAAVLAARAGCAGEASWIGELAALDGGSPIGLYALSRQT